MLNIVCAALQSGNQFIQRLNIRQRTNAFIILAADRRLSGEMPNELPLSLI
ncbi:hypothetical protein [Alkalicoccus luteus]|uniref:hypothetical protein n=1 Tax=Alkalicoccus luteus TaxID=1237094 RepID=UPI001439C7DA|nr:hypothetical protein [Alkalicoccus luteus]